MQRKNLLVILIHLALFTIKGNGQITAIRLPQKILREDVFGFPVKMPVEIKSPEAYTFPFAANKTRIYRFALQPMLYFYQLPEGGRHCYRITQSDSAWFAPMPRKAQKTYFDLAEFYDQSTGIVKIAVDNNGNHNFSDDSVYSIRGRLATMPFPFIKIDGIEQFNGREIFSSSPSIQPFYEQTGKTAFTRTPLNKPALSIFIRVADSFHYGIKRFGSEEYQFALNNSFIGGNNVPFIPSGQLLCRKLSDSLTDENWERFSYRQGDTILLDGLFYSIGKFVEDKYLLPIQKLEQQDGITGFDTGYFAPPFRLPNSAQNAELVFTGKPGRYIVLDFWGSWCVHCIEDHPRLITAYNKFKKQGVEFISIAYDNKKDFGKLRSIIRKSALNWPQAVQERKSIFDRSNIVNRYKVSAYPSFFLINPDGRIIYRSNGKEGLTELVRRLEIIFAAKKI